LGSKVWRLSMGVVSRNALTDGQTNVNGTDINEIYEDLFSEFNGSIDNNNIKAAANIDCTKTNGNFGTKAISTTGNISGAGGTFSTTLAVTGAVTADSTLIVSGAVSLGDKATLTKNIALTETTAPSTAASEGALYTKDTDGQPELWYREESDGDEVQITKGGLTGSTFVETGVYTGDGATSQAISLSNTALTAKYILITDRTTSGGAGRNPYYTTDTIIDDNAAGMAMKITSNGVDSAINAIIAFAAGSFTVDDAGSDSHPNKNGQVYNYYVVGE